jgi:hypothetical protein
MKLWRLWRHLQTSDSHVGDMATQADEFDHGFADLTANLDLRGA